jgi:hypothetical protein
VKLQKSEPVVDLVKGSYQPDHHKASTALVLHFHCCSIMRCITPSRTIQDTGKKAWLQARSFIALLVPDPQQVLP